MEEDVSHQHFAGMMTGIFDVHWFFASLLCRLGLVDASALVSAVERQIAFQATGGGTEAYVAGRQMAAKALHEGLLGTVQALSKEASAPAAKLRPEFEVILGGLAGDDGNTPESVPEK